MCVRLARVSPLFSFFLFFLLFITNIARIFLHRIAYLAQLVECENYQPSIIEVNVFPLSPSFLFMPFPCPCRPLSLPVNPPPPPPQTNKKPPLRTPFRKRATKTRPRHSGVREGSRHPDRLSLARRTET